VNAAARVDRALDQVGGIRAQLLDLEALTRLVEPEQRAGLKSQRRAQQIEVVVELLVDRLDRSL